VITRFDWLGRLGIEPAERPVFLWGGLCLLLQGAAAYALLNASETLFLKRVGVEHLPLVFLASSALLVVSTAWLGRGLASAERSRWLPRVLVALALLMLPFALLTGSASPYVYAALVLVARQVLAIGLLVFWLALGDLVTGRQAKRLFAPLTSGITLGAVAGSFGSDAVARIAGTGGLLATAAALLLAAAAAGARLRTGHAAGPERGGEAPRPEASRTRSGGGAIAALRAAGADAGPIELLRESRLFRLLLVCLLCGGMLSPVLLFEFSYVADAATAGEEELLSVYARFRGWLNVAMLAVQLWLSSRLYHTLGLPLSLALWPISYLLGFGWIAASPVLTAGIVGLGAGRLSEDGIAGSALRVLFNLFPEQLRSRASGLLEGPIQRLGGVAGNTGVLLVLQVGGAALIGLAALPVAAIWLLATLALWRAYPGLLLQASAQHGLAAGVDRARLLDARTVRALAPGLEAADPRTCRAAIDLVADAEPQLAVELLAAALPRAADENRSLLVDALHRLVEPIPPGSIRPGQTAVVLARVLGARTALPPEERADLVQIYARLTGGGAEAASSALLDRLLGDPEPAVRLAAIAELHRRGMPPPGAADLDALLRDGLAARDALVRRTARRELRAMLLSAAPDERWATWFARLVARLEQRADRAETAESLLAVARRHDGAAAPGQEAMHRILDDLDPRVRAAALAFAARAGASDDAPRLVQALGSAHRAELDAAHEGLVALGPQRAAALLGETAFPEAPDRDVLVAALRELDERELLSARRALVMGAAVDGAQDAALLRRRLAEAASDGIHTALALLAALRDDVRIGELERGLRRTQDRRRRDILVEGLEALLPPAERADLVPLLDGADSERLGERAARALGRGIPSPERAVAELREDADPLTRRLADALAPRLSAAAPIGDDSGAMSDPMEIAVRLQGVPAFDRLSTQQLVSLAEALRPEQHEAGGTIYGEGDEGSGVYFVVEGEVRLAAGPLELARAGPGEFFGELSVLDGEPHAATASAVDAVQLLRLERGDLFLLMERVPTFAIGLSQVLATRMRALEGRLRASASTAEPRP
jgi:hypothetical protein